VNLEHLTSILPSLSDEELAELQRAVVRGCETLETLRLLSAELSGTVTLLAGVSE
jgi:hypothetical protein